MARIAAGFFALAAGIVSLAVAGCGNAQDAPAPSALPVFTDIGDAAPIEIAGVLWTGGGTVVGVLDHVRNGDEGPILDVMISAGSISASKNGIPIVALTNTVEVDCADDRYRKLADTYLSAEAHPLSRGVYGSPRWQAGLSPVLRRACGDTTVEPNGPAFTGMTEFLALFDAEARRLGVTTRITGPTITRSE